MDAPTRRRRPRGIVGRMLLPALAKIAQEQHGVFRRSQALANGYDDVTIDRYRRQGVWVPVRHGVYATAERHARAMADPRLGHLLEAAARRLVIAGDTVLSHETAAVFHGINLLDPIVGEPRLTRHRPDGVDFAWPAYRTVCELDGKVKYADQQVLWQEKRREDALRDLGLEVVRGYWSDGTDAGQALAARLRRAFARGARAVGDPASRLSPPPTPVHRPPAAPLSAAG